MTIKNNGSAVLAVLLAAVVMAGCSDDDALVGSCNAGIASDGSKFCIDYYDVDKSAFRGLCTGVMRGRWSESACNPQGALGGCSVKNGSGAIWIYPSARHETQEDVQEFCARKQGRFLYPS